MHAVSVVFVVRVFKVPFSSWLVLFVNDSYILGIDNWGPLVLIYF